MDKKRMSTWVRKNCRFAAISRDETEIKYLMDKGLVEESSDFEEGKYRILGIPDEFGEWYLWYMENPDGRGGTIGTWSVLQESDNNEGDFWAETYEVQEAYDWAMKNHRNPTE